MRSHSSAIAADASAWSQASRPKAYQLAQREDRPHQLRSVPVLATPAMPVVRALQQPSTTRRPSTACRRVRVGVEHFLEIGAR